MSDDAVLPEPEVFDVKIINIMDVTFLHVITGCSEETVNCNLFLTGTKTFLKYQRN